MDYGISARAYLDRAKKRYSDATNESLFYAAFELRCAIEARLQEILEPYDHVSENSKRSYQVGKLSKTVSDKLCDPDTGTKIIIQSDREEVTLRYIPVSSSLRKFAQRAGDYLHAAQKKFDEKTWENFRNEIMTAINNLEENLGGNLLGPILMDKNGEARLFIEIIDDNHPSSVFAKKLMLEKPRITIKVDYFKVS